MAEVAAEHRQYVDAFVDDLRHSVNDGSEKMGVSLKTDLSKSLESLRNGLREWCARIEPEESRTAAGYFP
eukprot:8584045-Pyramimonas_sp.AAC.1